MARRTCPQSQRGDDAPASEAYLLAGLPPLGTHRAAVPNNNQQLALVRLPALRGSLSLPTCIHAWDEGDPLFLLIDDRRPTAVSPLGGLHQHGH